LSKKAECNAAAADSLSGFEVAFKTLTLPEICAVIARGFDRLAELTAQPEPPPDAVLTREEAVKVVEEASADRFLRRGIYERARINPNRKKPLYSRSKLLEILEEEQRRAAIAAA